MSDHPAWSVRDREEPPAPGDALQLALAPILEFDPGPGDEVLDGARHDDLRRLRGRRHALADVHREPADVVATKLDLAGVQADAHVDVQGGRGRTDRTRAANTARGPVERREEPVTGRLDLVATEGLELAADGVRRAHRGGPSNVGHRARLPARWTPRRR